MDLKGQELYQNVFYFRYINKIGGIETWFYQLAKKYKNKDIVIYYNAGDKTQIDRLKKYVRVLRYNQDEKIKCKKMFFCFNLDIINNVEAEEYNVILHGDYKTMIDQGQLDIKYLPINDKINNYYGVSKTVCDGFKKLTGIKAKVLYNPIEIEKPKRVLDLISATRLTSEKGKDRIIKLSKMLEEENIPYTWTIFTDDTNAIENENIIYKKPRLDIINYMANSDYLVQLSDNEGYCYSIVESLCVGTPVIVTNIPVVKEIGVKDHENGFILDFDLENVPIKEIYESKLKFKYEPLKDEWEDVLQKGKSTYQEDIKHKVKVKSLFPFEDIESGTTRIIGEEWTINKARLKDLKRKNQRNIELIEVIKEEK